MSSTFTVVFFLKTITAANATNIIVEVNGEILKAFSNVEDTELLII